MILIYDTSFEGFLTAVFCAYEQKCNNPKIVKKHCFMGSFFEESETVFTSEEKAQRVWKKVKKNVENQVTLRFTELF